MKTTYQKYYKRGLGHVMFKQLGLKKPTPVIYTIYLGLILIVLTIYTLL